MKYLFLLAVVFSSMAFAQETSGPNYRYEPCSGPGGCGAVVPDPEPTGPVFLCIPCGLQCSDVPQRRWVRDCGLTTAERLPGDRLVWGM